MRHTLDLIMRVRQHSQPDLILASNGPERDMVRQNSGSSCSSTGSWNGNRDTYRLVVLGAGGVGKSSLVSRYVLGEFTRVYQPTLEDSYRHLVQLPDGVFQSIEIVDTAGYHQFPAMQQLSIQCGNAFFVVFEISNRQSFDHAQHLLHMINFTKGNTKTPIILVGNKKDLEETRQVTVEEAQIAAEEHACGYLETSAKDNANIDNVFAEILARSFSCERNLDLASKTKLRKRRLSSKIGNFRKDSTSSSGDEQSTASCVVL